jgi:hypothetical protein
MSQHPAKAYIRPEASLNDDPIQFFPVAPADVSALVASTGGEVPDHVLTFWSEVGYGFVNASLDGAREVDWTNLIMSPIRVEKTLKASRYARMALRESPPRVPVFSGDEDAIFCASKNGAISYVSDARIVVADSLHDLAAKLLEDPTFYIPLTWPGGPSNA